MTHTEPLLYTAATTPFTDSGELDRDHLDEYHAWLKEADVDGVFSVGTTGEFVAMSDDERTETIASAVRVFGPERVIAHIGAPTLRQACTLLDRAGDVGAVRFAAMTPYFEAPTIEGLRRYYEGLSGRCDGRLFAYHFPARTAVAFTGEQLSELFTEVALGGIKVSGLPADKVLSYLPPGAEGFQLFTGGDASFAQCYLGGAVGAVSGLSSAFPEVFVQMRNALAAGDDAAIHAAQGDIDQVVEVLESGNLALVKHAINARGFPAGPVRVALDPVSDAQQARIDGLFRELGLRN